MFAGEKCPPDISIGIDRADDDGYESGCGTQLISLMELE